MTSKTQPNIVFIVLDACRADYSEKYAPTLGSLGDEGLKFTNAIAPATWTQPSHSSFFTGKYPHEHGVTRPGQSSGPTDLFDNLAKRGYTTHGISGNGFISPLWGYDEAFDTFRYTQTPEPFPTGMDTYSYLRNNLREKSALAVAGSVPIACGKHDHPVRSILNLMSTGTNAVVRRYLRPLIRIPHQTFSPNPQHSYSPEKNTKLVTDVIHEQADHDSPFFIFANYMDTHRPYQSSSILQEKHVGKALSMSEFIRLNDDVAAPWEFIRLVQNDEIDGRDIETLRNLYAASVASVDSHIAQVITALKEANVRDDTVIVIVGDHGENLGETDEMGRRRFGHEASISDALAQVPLIIDHPELNGEYDHPVSAKEVFEFITNVSDPDVSLPELEPVFNREVALCEYPALADENLYEEYPDIDDQYLQHRVSMDSVAAYRDNWRVVVESDGTEIAFQGGEQCEIETAPKTVVRSAHEACNKLGTLGSDGSSKEVENRLKELGYL